MIGKKRNLSVHLPQRAQSQTGFRRNTRHQQQHRGSSSKPHGSSSFSLRSPILYYKSLSRLVILLCCQYWHAEADFDDDIPLPQPSHLRTPFVFVLLCHGRYNVVFFAVVSGEGKRVQGCARFKYGLQVTHKINLLHCDQSLATS